jgi:hypothetical protein
MRRLARRLELRAPTQRDLMMDVDILIHVHPSAADTGEAAGR